jgi:hypothetical protein
MTVISSKEFATNHKKYLDTAITEEVCIKRGRNMFYLLCKPISNTNIKERVYYEPDDDFYSSITVEELREKVLEDVHQWYREKNENSSPTKSTAVS